MDLFQFLQVPAVQVPRITSAEERRDDDCIVHLLVSLEGVCNAVGALSCFDNLRVDLFVKGIIPVDGATRHLKVSTFECEALSMAITGVRETVLGNG